MADRVVASMQEETVVEGRRVDTTISVGLARQLGRVPDDSAPDRRDGSGWATTSRSTVTTLAEREAAAALLLRGADSAMYAAKGAGKNRVRSSTAPVDAR